MQRLSIERLDEADPRRESALQFLLSVGGEPAGETQRRLEALKIYILEQSLNLSTVIGAFRADILISAVMLIESPGRLGAVFVPSRSATGIRGEALISLLSELQIQAWDRSLTLIQFLLALEDRSHIPHLTAAGFKPLADLAYLERKTDDPIPLLPKGSAITFQTFSEKTRSLFLQTLEQTYIESQDCPGLTGIRPVEDILQTHAATGIHRPEWWHLAMRDDEPVGVILLSGVRNRADIEVVYMGVLPSARRQGVADQLLNVAVACCRQERAERLTLAVDKINMPAKRLYSRWGFLEVGQREAWLAVNPAFSRTAG